MRQSGSSAARSAGFSVERSGIESKGTAGRIATPRLYAVGMNQRLVYIAGGVLAATLAAFAIWRDYQPKQTPSATLHVTERRIERRCGARPSARGHHEREGAARRLPRVARSGISDGERREVADSG